MDELKPLDPNILRLEIEKLEQNLRDLFWGNKTLAGEYKRKVYKLIDQIVHKTMLRGRLLGELQTLKGSQ